MKKNPFTKTLGIEGTCLNTINAVHNKHVANAVLNKEKWKIFSLKSRMWQGYLLSSLLFNRALEFLAMAIRLEKEIKGYK
jgi:hypothetical protein